MSVLKEQLTYTPIIKQKNGYFFLKNQSRLVNIRQNREKISNSKMKLAKKTAKILSFIPMVKFIGLSGSLALKNAQKNHDIDFFIIASANTLWCTRFLVVTTLFLLGLKRKPGSAKVKNSVCTNMFMELNSLTLPKSKQNLYTAHEIVQILPLVNKNRAFENFIAQNRWVKKYLANTHIPSLSFSKKNSRLFSYIDQVFFKIQYFYMKKKIKKEVVKNTIAMFHPRDYQGEILQQFETLYKSFNNRTKKENKIDNFRGKTLTLKHAQNSLVFTPGS